MKYIFSSKPYKDNRTLYMYTPYEGSDFISAYRKNRQAILEQLELFLRSNKGEYLTCDPASSANLQDTSALIELLAAGRQVPEEITNILLKKFETTRQIRKGYTQHLKIHNSEEISPRHYALLAAWFAEQLDSPRLQLKILNCLLKLNDYLACRLEEFESDSLACQAFYKAVQLELTSITQLESVAEECYA